MISLKIETQAMEFEVDSGVACTLISENTYRQMWPEHPPRLNQDDMTLHNLSGEGVRVLGTANVHVRQKFKDYRLPLLWTRGRRCSLLGRHWFDALEIQVGGIHHKTREDQGAKHVRQSFYGKITKHNSPPVYR